MMGNQTQTVLLSQPHLKGKHTLCSQIALPSFDANRRKKLFSVNKNNSQALTLLGPTRENPVPDPLSAQHLDNRLSIYLFFSVTF